MEEKRNAFMCGMCRAGFSSCSFLQFVEHIVRHFSVARNNSCLICHKRFARTLSMKEHLLHYHAIPLKNSPEAYSGTEDMDNAMINSSARCSYLHKKEFNERDCKEALSSNSNALIQKQPPNISTTGNYNLLNNSKITVWEGTDNSNSSVDVLTIKTVEHEANATCNLDWSSEQNRQLSNDFNEVGTLPVNEMSFEETLDKNVFPGNVKVCSNNSEVVIQSCSNDTQIGTLSCEDSQLITSNMNVQLSSSNIQGNLGSYALDSSDIDNSLSMNVTSKSKNVQFVTCSQKLNNFEQKSNFDGCQNVGKEFSTEVRNVNSKPKTKISSPLLSLSSGGKDLKNSLQNDPTTKVNGESIDFHFFLGTTVINGNSITYNRIEFRCLHCPFACSWRPSLVKHMKHVHMEALDFHKILDIKHIKSKSSQDVKLNKYKVMKLSDYILASKTVRERKKRVRGIELQDKLGKYSCPVCNKVFRRMRYVRRHQLSHATEKSHLCDVCGKSFKTKASLLTHHRSHKSRSYHCPQCDFVSNLSSAIHRHRQIHPNGSVMCDICGAAYIDKSTLKKHRHVHDINRPFPCTFPGCTWRFKTENIKKAHLKSHTSEGKFRCLHCGYRFRQKHHLQRHLEKIHSQLNVSSKLNSDSLLSSSPDLKSDIIGSSFISQQGIHCEEDFMKNSANLTLMSTESSCNPQELIFSSANGNMQPTSADIPSNACVKIRVPQTSMRICSEDKPVETFIHVQDNSLESSVIVKEDKPVDPSARTGLDEENNFPNISSSNLGNLEFVTENIEVEVMHLIKPSLPGQVYVRHDQHGNLVEYRITDIHTGDENQSQQIYVIGSDGNVLAAGIEGQSLSLS